MSEEEYKSSNLNTALWYAQKGLPVFPLMPGEKTPDTPHGFYDATTNPDRIKSWWQENPERNIGIATGMDPFNLVVIDQDFHPERGIDGKEFLRSWESDHGPLPPTWTATSATGGQHLYFRGTGSESCSEDKNHEFGIDIRGKGGYVMAPPSLHPCGKRYSWDLAPGEIKLATANDRVSELIKFVQKDEDRRLRMPNRIDEGSRNWTLYRAACSMQSTGFPDEAIEAAIYEVNRVCCYPPLQDKEVNAIVKSALKREKGGAMTKWSMSSEEMKLKILEEMKLMRGSIPK